MSSIQTIIIVAVVILIIVVVALMLLINRKQLREVEVIDAALNEIEEMHLEDDIKRLNKMDLAGESLTTLNTWRKSYKEASTKKLPRVKKLVEEAANENATYKLFKARKKIKEAQQIIKPALEDARNTKAVFTELLESNKENQIQYDALIKVYRELRKDVLANSFEYGTAIDQIEDQLASMESDFEEAKNLSSQGDHVEAKRVLSKIRMSLAALQKQLPKIKDGYHQLEVVFQDQLKELSNVYKKMISEKYYITKVDVLSRIKDIHDQIDSARKLLAELKVDELANENKRCRRRVISSQRRFKRNSKTRMVCVR